MSVAVYIMRALLLVALIAGATPAPEAQEAEKKPRPRLTIKLPSHQEVDQLTNMANNVAEEAKKNASPQAEALAQQKLAVLDEQMKQVLARNAENRSAQVGGADYWLMRKNFGAAEEQAEKALSMGSPDGDPVLTSKLLTTKAIAMYQRGDVPGAWATSLQALEYDPYNTAAIETVKYTEGRGPRSQVGLDGTADADKDNVQRLVAVTNPTQPHTDKEWADKKAGSPVFDAVVKASKARRMGDLRGALRHADEAIEADPDDPMARFYKGKTLMDSGDPDGAVLEISKAMKQGWNEETMWTVRAQALLQAGKDVTRAQAAVKDLDIALAINPDNADALAARSAAKLRLGDVAGMLADAQKAASLNPARFTQFFDNAKLRAEEAQARNGQQSGQDVNGAQAEGRSESAGQSQGSSGIIGALTSAFGGGGQGQKAKNGGKAKRRDAVLSDKYAIIGFATGCSILLLGAGAYFWSSPGPSPEQLKTLNPRNFHRDGRPRTDPGKFRGVDDITI